MGSQRQFRRSKNIVFSCQYHVIWCTKYRRPVLVEDVAMRLRQIALDLAGELNCEILSLEIVEDHVHMLVDVDPQFGVHRFVRRVKGRTSRLLRREFKPLRTRIPTLWTNSYFVATVGGAPLERVKKYIEDQKNQ